jgi:hypothetical protein
MTQKKAKELSLEVWRYLRDHPEICLKDGLPKDLWEDIFHLVNACPLCQFFRGCSSDCPLGGCVARDTPYMKWGWSKTNKERQEAAAEIVRRIEAWEPEVEKRTYYRGFQSK